MIVESSYDCRDFAGSSTIAQPAGRNQPTSHRSHDLSAGASSVNDLSPAVRAAGVM
jgi:hypothetical protein